ncbi:hypothetical protein V6N13_035135 [Hibiscus sabdariffa]
MSVVDLIFRLRIEEDNRGNAKKLTFKEAKVNVVKVRKGKQPQHHQVRLKLGSIGGLYQKEKFKGVCYNCGKVGHRSSECKNPKRAKNNEANDVDDVDLCTVISKVNLVDSNLREWWLDIGATRHICGDENSFVKLSSSDDGEKLYIRNYATFKIKGKGIVVLRMISAKELELQNVLKGDMEDAMEKVLNKAYLASSLATCNA